MDRPLITLDFLAEFIESGPPIPNHSPQLMEIMIAQVILIYLLGQEVADQLCLSHSIERRFDSARRYLRQDPDEKDTVKHQVERGARLVWLAEALYNMQAVEGFDKLICDIRDGNLQAAWEEAAFAMLLVQREVPFRFLHPSNVPGKKMPDIEITLGGVKILCEVEGKKEHTLVTEKSVYNTLEHARKQLPSDLPGLICLKIPELWKGEPAIRMVFTAINQFLNRTQRVVAVMLRSERHSPKVDDSVPSESAALLILRRNHSSRLLTPAVNAALDHIWNGDGTIGGTPVAALAYVLHELNTARTTLLGNPDATHDFQTVKAAFLGGIRKELAQRVPPLRI